MILYWLSHTTNRWLRLQNSNEEKTGAVQTMLTVLLTTVYHKQRRLATFEAKVSVIELVLTYFLFL